MKEHIAENPEKTRRAVATGKCVVFSRRMRKGTRYAAPVVVLRKSYGDHELASRAADAWAFHIKIN